jgi:malate dehydrogenase (quinone)
VISTKHYDVVLVGGGIMSATLGTLLKLVKPELSIQVYERLEAPALESTNPWNNAGTGHAALCELNYMPDSTDGSLPSPAKAVSINEQFQVSRQFWAYLVEQGILGDPETFIHAVPHMTFVRGEKDVDYLSRRFESLKSQPLFAGMEFSTDPEKIAEWAPLLIQGRGGSEAIAATRIESGTDVDFGSITRQLFAWLEQQGVEIATGHEVKSVKRTDDIWQLRIANQEKPFSVTAVKVFVGAGGWALKLLQSSGIPEAKGYGSFPVSGAFLRTYNPDLVEQHQAKVYSQASVGAPPMSVPHLDTRVVDGEKSLLFGPYAGANPKFLKNGSIFDLPFSIRFANMIPYLAVGAANLPLVKYLVTEVLKTKRKKFESLLDFVPTADPLDWDLIIAGQRAQVIKKDAAKGGVLQFGTEVVMSADGSLSGLLGASPGASTGTDIMLKILLSAFADEAPSFESKIRAMIPSFGTVLSDDPKKAAASLKATAKTLKIK